MEHLKRHMISLLITFGTTFAFVALGMLNVALENGDLTTTTLTAILVAGGVAGLRAVIKVALELLTVLKKKIK